jgi:hypothetical protein
MKVKDLRDVMEGMDDDDEVRILEEGYRNRSYNYAIDAKQVQDDRTHDDWGMEKEPLGVVLLIEMGDVADNRYPPGDDDEE